MTEIRLIDPLNPAALFSRSGVKETCGLDGVCDILEVSSIGEAEYAFIRTTLPVVSIASRLTFTALNLIKLNERAVTGLRLFYKTRSGLQAQVLFIA
jgi:hypothetical protein